MVSKTEYFTQTWKYENGYNMTMVSFDQHVRSIPKHDFQSYYFTNTLVEHQNIVPVCFPSRGMTWVSLVEDRHYIDALLKWQVSETIDKFK